MQSGFQGLHATQKRSAWLFFSGFFGIPLLAGFVAINSGASEPIATFVAIGCMYLICRHRAFA